MSRLLDADAYLQIRRHATWNRYEARVMRVTQRRPDEESVLPGCVVVKVKIQIPSAAFDPLQPEAVVVIPEDLIQRPVYVTAEDPSS